MTTPASPAARRRRRGRVAAIATFYSLVVVFIVVLAVELTWQSVMPSTRAYEPIDCRAGLRSLASAIESARQASEGTQASPEEALQRFRRALSPAWDDRDRVEGACKGTNDKALLEAFDVIERLRYAEENAVRRDARDLGPLRRGVRALLSGPLAEPGR